VIYSPARKKIDYEHLRAGVFYFGCPLG